MKLDVCRNSDKIGLDDRKPHLIILVELHSFLFMDSKKLEGPHHLHFCQSKKPDALIQYLS